MDKDNKSDQSRRNFLKTIGGISLGSLAFSTCGFLGSCSKNESNEETIKVLSPDGELVEVSKNKLKSSKKKKPVDDSRIQGIPGRKFVMVIDLSKCRNARECMKVCQKEHQLRPEQHHINVLTMQDTDKTAPYFMPKPCQHCDNPHCVSVCPVSATFKRTDGIVLIDNERCIGCRFCMAACPYSARTFNWKKPKDADKYKGVKYDIEKNVPQKKGTVTKCCFSADQLRKNELPYCVTSCPNGVYWFGDANEDAVTNGTSKETVSLNKLLEDNAAYQLMNELGTKPRVYYLPPKNRVFRFKDVLEETENNNS